MRVVQHVGNVGHHGQFDGFHVEFANSCFQGHEFSKNSCMYNIEVNPHT